MIEIVSYIIGEQTRFLEMINGFNNQIKEIMLRRGGMGEFADLINQFVSCPTMISDQVHKSFVFRSDDPKWEAILGHVVPASVPTASIYNEPGLTEIRTSFDLVDGEKIRRYSIPIYFDDSLYGFIYIWDVNNCIN